MPRSEYTAMRARIATLEADKAALQGKVERRNAAIRDYKRKDEESYNVIEDLKEELREKMRVAENLWEFIAGKNREIESLEAWRCQRDSEYARSLVWMAWAEGRGRPDPWFDGFEPQNRR